MIEDLKTITEHVKQQFPNQKIYALGHSLGGQIGALAQAKYPNLFDGLILSKYFPDAGVVHFPLINSLNFLL